MNGNISKYQQVIQWVQERLKSGELTVGQKLESENEISQYFGISRQTVRHALSVLEKKGVIESRQGSGSYILPGNGMEKAKKSTGLNTAVIVSTYIDGYIFPNVMRGMIRVLEKEKWKTRIMFTNNEFETERKVLRQLLEDEEIGGIIMEPVRTEIFNPNVDDYRALCEKNIPIIFLHSYCKELDIPHVSVNDRKVGYMAVRYLLERGHRKIAGIFKLDDGRVNLRYSGYVQALSESQIEISNKKVLWMDTEEVQDMYRSKDRILKRLEDCTACFCYSDEIAVRLLKICEMAGIAIPEKLSVISVRNLEFSEWGGVTLTSVTYPLEELGEKAASNILTLWNNPMFHTSYECEPKIETGNSVKTLKQKYGEE